MPTPLHGWRPFWGEVGVVVLGVLLALGAQQAVEWAQWRDDVADARSALDNELARNIGGFKRRLAMMPCVSARIDELGRWAQSLETAAPLKLRRPIGSPSRRTVASSVWDVTKSGQIAARMPLDIRVAYAALYDVLILQSAQTASESDLWSDLRAYDDAPVLVHEDVMRLRQIIGRLRRLNQIAGSNTPYVMGLSARTLRIPPVVYPRVAIPDEAQFCTPLLASARLHG